MERISKHLRADYIRTIRKLNLPDESSLAISTDDVLRAHYLICDYFEAENNTKSVYGLRDEGLLISAVHRQATEFGGIPKWNDQFAVGASLFYGLNKNHAFHDGNKRTALLSLLLYIHRINRVPTLAQRELEDLTVHVAANQLSEKYPRFEKFIKKPDPVISFIADFIRRHTRKRDTSYYSLTYEEFNARLRPYGYCLDRPRGNHINVFKIRTGLLGNKQPKRIFQIGFPGWKKQINLKAAKETLKACNLTPENGIDSHVFFLDGEPLYKLIHTYEGPLKRLRDK